MTGRPRWAREPEFSVFVNCPFDRGFRSNLDAIVLSCVSAGFLPWTAGSTGATSRGRIERILEGIAWCRYSIHDLSRYRGEGAENLSRLNMPLELGIAMGVRGRNPDEQAHDWMVMCPAESDFKRYVSDLAGIDPLSHDGTPQQVCTAVLAWLVTHEGALLISPSDVAEKLPVYSARIEALEREWAGSEPPWERVLQTALAVVAGASDRRR